MALCDKNATVGYRKHRASGEFPAVAMHALGCAWPTGGHLILNVMAWPIGGAVWGRKMHRLLRNAAASRPPGPGPQRSGIDPF